MLCSFEVMMAMRKALLSCATYHISCCTLTRNSIYQCCCFCQVSPDVGLVQSSTVADQISFKFDKGQEGMVAGSYLEFAQRAVMPQYKHLQVRLNHLPPCKHFQIRLNRLPQYRYLQDRSDHLPQCKHLQLILNRLPQYKHLQVRLNHLPQCEHLQVRLI